MFLNWLKYTINTITRYNLRIVRVFLISYTIFELNRNKMVMDA